MTSPSELSDFLARLNEKRSRLTEMAAAEGSTEVSELIAEVADLGEQLLVADEELRAQHEQLAESRSKLEALSARNEQLFDAAPQALLITDAHGIMLDRNRAASALLAGQDSSGSRRPVTSLFQSEYRRVIRSLITGVRTGQPAQRAEVERAGDGVRLAVQVQAFQHPLTDQHLLRWELSLTAPALAVVTPLTGRLPEREEEAADLVVGEEATMAMLREADWSASPLGPMRSWPSELRAAVRTVLASKVPMLIWWGPQLIQLYNQAYRALVGNKHPAALGQPAAECWAEIWPAIGPRAVSVLAGNGASYFENDLLFLERAGYQEETYWTYSYSPITGDSGEVLGVFVATAEVTDRQVATRQMVTIRELGALSVAESGSTENVCQQALRVLARNRESIPFAAVYALGEDGQARLQGCYGLFPAGTELPAVIPASDQDSAVSRVLGTGAAASIDADTFAPGALYLPSPLGPATPRTIRLQPVWLSGRGPQPHAVLAMGCNPYRTVDESCLRFLDLAARQLGIALTDAAAYDAEHRRAEAFAELDQAKTRFFENISHEFRTPLTLMMAPIDALLDDPEVNLPADRRADVTSARRAVLRLSRLVDTLLEFAQAEADELHAELELTDLARLSTDVTSMFRSVVEETGLALVVDTAEVTEPIAVDPEMVTKILLNLLSNAVKFTPKGSITLRLAEGGDEVCLTVSDTGLGISAEELPRVFERFHQVPVRGARSREGAGIGLSLVSDLAHAHGGEVSVRSELGSGSEFTVRLPRATVGPHQQPVAGGGCTVAPAFIAEAHTWSGTRSDPVPAEAGSQPEPAGGAEALPGGKILLVEDNVDMRDYLTRLLRADGWQVEAVGSVEEALAGSVTPDLVLSDVMLPDRSGLELVELMRANPMLMRIPVILLTARAGAASASEGLRAGADDYIVKPFAAEELLARVHTHYELARLREYALNRAEDRAANLERALVSNRQIGTAMGIVMARLKLTDEQAFDLLRKISQNRHRKLRDIAEEVALTGEIPHLHA
ncbi:ATP-binding protein [Jatrophihabitans sp.]|jgi:signal transduction histidine kinase/DNA-binding response OmpR family regulator/PAS domain-containing protein|uniref:ATP-binding protein n=1 Tax=Jatrophihabitans sp. TaxID=1932789 RepID=UPI002F1E80B3